nr:aminoacyl-tRNA synthetase, class 1a, anticodon-binding [Tanacetum cinerariifolium]
GEGIESWSDYAKWYHDTWKLKREREMEMDKGKYLEGLKEFLLSNKLPPNDLEESEVYRYIDDDAFEVCDDYAFVNFSDYFANKPNGGSGSCKLKVEATLEVDFAATSKETKVVGKVMAYYDKNFCYGCPPTKKDHYSAMLFETEPDSDIFVWPNSERICCGSLSRRPSVDSTFLNDFEMATNENRDDVPPPEGGDLPVPDLRTMEELCQPTLNGRHLDKFLHVTQSIKVNGVTDDALRLYLFSHSLTHHATAWFDRLLRYSITTFEQMAKMFLGKYFPPSMVTKLRIDITNFRQHTFYNGLTLRHRDTINVVACGTFMKRRPEECYDLIENMTTHHNDWDTSVQRSESYSSITSSSVPKIIALKVEIEEINKNLMKVLQINQQVKAVTHNCETCGGPHSYNDCSAIVGQTRNVYAARAYNQGGNSYQPQENRNLLNYHSDNYLGPPGFNQNQNRNNPNQNYQNQNRNQGNNQEIPQRNNQGRNQFFQGANHGQNPAYQAPAYQAPGYQAPVHQVPIPQPQVVTTTEFTTT